MGTSKKQECHPFSMRKSAWVKKKNHKPDITINGNAIKSGFDAMDILARELTC